VSVDSFCKYLYTASLRSLLRSGRQSRSFSFIKTQIFIRLQSAYLKILKAIKTLSSVLLRYEASEFCIMKLQICIHKHYRFRSSRVKPGMTGRFFIALKIIAE
jgi:hypothetical protein